jgi:hypothetical protein
LTSRAEARKRKRKKRLWPQTVVVASNRLMNSFRVRIRKGRHTKKKRKRKKLKSQREKMKNMRKRRKGRSRRQSQMTKKPKCPHALKPIPQPFPCQGRARLQVLRKPKGPWSMSS